MADARYLFHHGTIFRDDGSERAFTCAHRVVSETPKTLTVEKRGTDPYCDDAVGNYRIRSSEFEDGGAMHPGEYGGFWTRESEPPPPPEWRPEWMIALGLVRWPASAAEVRAAHAASTHEGRDEALAIGLLVLAENEEISRIRKRQGFRGGRSQ